MITTRTLSLPQAASFYEDRFKYSVEFDPKACGALNTIVDGKTVNFTYSSANSVRETFKSGDFTALLHV